MQKIILGVALVLAVGVGGWLAFSSQSNDGLANLGSSAGTKLTDAQVQQVIARVSKYMVLPSEENPSVVVIADAATRAEQQSFYRGAKDGDLLIVYSSRAIIYDPKANKLVNVGPIQQNTATPVPSADASPSPSASPLEPEKVVIEVRNGTSTAGLAGKTASDLKKNAWVTSTKVADAKNSYLATVLVDLSGGKKPGAIAALEKLFGVKAVTDAPKGEATSTADVLVIVGK